MTSFHRLLTIILFLSLFGHSCLHAQLLLVQVRDASSGAGLAGAVLALDQSGRMAVSDAAGLLTVEGLEPGTYSGFVRADGFRGRPLRIELDHGAMEVRHQIFLTPVVHDLEAFEVNAALEDADKDVLARRNSVVPREQISGEALREAADDQVSDALERVAGVTVNEEDGNVSGVNIRGAGARQTRITVDGQGLSGGGGRGTTRGVRAMNRIPREFLEQIHIMKASTPDMDADAIGGTVDLQTSRISRSKEPRTSISLRSSYSEAPGMWGHRASLTQALPIELNRPERRLGLLVGVNWEDFENAGDELRVLNQWPLRPDPASGGEHRMLARLRTGTRENTRSGYGLLFNSDLQWGGANHFYFKAIWNEFENDSLFNSQQFDFIRGNTLSLEETGGSFERMRLEKQFVGRRIHDTSGSIVIGGEHLVGDWVLEESIGYSFASNASPDDFAAAFRTGRTIDGGYSLEPDWRLPSVFLSMGGRPLRPEEFREFGEYSFYRYDLIDREADDGELAARINLVRKWESASASWTLKTGLKGRFRDAENDEDMLPYRDGAESLWFDAVSRPGPASAFGGRYPLGPGLDEHALAGLLVSSPEYFSLDPDDVLLNSLRSDFSVEENIMAGYFMAQRESEKWVFIAGLRLERTEFETTGYETVSLNGGQGVDIRKITASDSYDMAFPGLHFLYRPGNTLAFRGSMTRALQRPDFRDLNPSLRVNLDSRRIRAGNPELEPFDAKAADLGMDMILNEWSSVSIGLFYKRIDDFIVDIEEETTYQGEEGYIIAQPVNGSPAKIFGVETAFTASLNFLPDPLAGTVLDINYTWTDSTASYPGHPGEVIMLPEQVRQTLNASLRWRHDNWTLSLRSRYRGLQLRDLVEPGQDQFFEGFWSHSISVNYKLNDSATLSFAANGVNAPNRVMYQGREGRVILNREGSRTLSIGLNVRFGRGKALRYPAPVDGGKEGDEV